METRTPIHALVIRTMYMNCQLFQIAIWVRWLERHTFRLILIRLDTGYKIGVDVLSDNAGP